MSGYTWRERLADWISGGALSAETKRALEFQREADRSINRAWKLAAAIYHIEKDTRNVKSGTARKINRMAKDALK